jgi:hypothetical protein
MQPFVKPLSLWRRKLVFGTLLLAFLISLPAFIFYAAGYRYNFSTTNQIFTVTGSFYLAAEAPESVIYIDDVEIQNARTFRNAFYIQGLEPGIHRVHVQAPGLYTWVKELTISPHIVTQVESFNLPLQPQVRLVAEYTTAEGKAVVFGRATSSPVLSGIASTTVWQFSTSTATSTYRSNQEFALLADLFAEKASTTAYLEKIRSTAAKSPFGFSTSSVEELPVGEQATTTIIRDSIKLYQVGDEVFAYATSTTLRQAPHYFCRDESLIEEEIINAELVASTYETIKPADSVELPSEPSCRSEIRIDRKGMKVIGFAFHPTNTNLVLMHLEDGIYVVEIDDRAWQNTQVLYPGKALEFIIYRGGTFIKEGELIFEVLTELPE